MASIINISGELDLPDDPKVYYIQIEYEDHVYHKIGHTQRSVAQRFSKESPAITITIKKLWRHTTFAKAEMHEARLFRELKGDRPFIGKMGPLMQGGNTEIFYYDPLNNENPHPKFKIHSIDPSGWSNSHFWYAHFDPYIQFKNPPLWVEKMRAPDWPCLLVREKCCGYKNKIVVCSEEYAEKIVDKTAYSSIISRSVARRCLEENAVVSDYSDAIRVAFGSNWLPLSN